MRGQTISSAIGGFLIALGVIGATTGNYLMFPMTPLEGLTILSIGIVLAATPLAITIRNILKVLSILRNRKSD